jgi:hypothetical protein
MNNFIAIFYLKIVQCKIILFLAMKNLDLDPDLCIQRIWIRNNVHNAALQLRGLGKFKLKQRKILYYKLMSHKKTRLNFKCTDKALSVTTSHLATLIQNTDIIAVLWIRIILITRIRIRIHIKVISWIRSRNNLQMTNQNVSNMRLFEHFFKSLSLYL